jgi:hypothetical protein
MHCESTSPTLSRVSKASHTLRRFQVADERRLTVLFNLQIQPGQSPESPVVFLRVYDDGPHP